MTVSTTVLANDGIKYRINHVNGFFGLGSQTIMVPKSGKEKNNSAIVVRLSGNEIMDGTKIFSDDPERYELTIKKILSVHL